MENDKKFFYLANDTTFKYLFKNPKIRPFFEELIKYYTGLDISDFNFIDNELNSGNVYVDYRLDSILTNNDKSIILNVEMNREHKNYVDIRNRRYVYRLAGTSKDNKYSDEKVVIQLNFNCFLSSDDKNLCTNTYMLKDSDNDLTIEDFKIHNIYIPKEEEMCYNENIKKKLKLFLCNSYEEMRNITKDNKEMESIVDELERLNQDKYFGGLYNAKEEQQMLENSAREEGFEQGIEQGVLSAKGQIAKTMIATGSDIEYVSKCTGLTIDEINNIL